MDTSIRGFMRSQWVSRGALKKQKSMNEKVDRVVHTLEKFAKLVSRKWRVLLDKREQLRRLRSTVLPMLEGDLGRSPNWGLLMYEEDIRQKKIQKEQNFKQAGDLYRSFSQQERQDLIDSFGGSLATADDASKHIILSFLYKADPDYGTGVAKVVNGDLARVKTLAAALVD